MSKKVIETLVTELTADGAKFKKEMDDSLKKATTWGQKMNSITKGIAIGGLAGGATLAAGLTVLTKSAIDTADAFDEQSQRVNVAVEDLSAYTYQAKFAGVSSDELNGALLKLNKTSADAFNGVGKGAEAFEMLGISVEDTDGKIKNNSQLLGEIADRFSELEDGPQKTALAMDIFGKSVGGKLVPMLNGGTEEMKFFREEAERLNLVVSSETAAAAGAFNDNLDKLESAASGLGLRLASEVLPSMIEFTDLINDPQTQTGIANIATGIVNIGTSAVSAIAGVSNFAKWIAESVAASIHGPSADDIVRLEDELEKLEQRKKNNRRGASKDLEQEIAYIKQLITNYYDLQGAIKRPDASATPAGSAKTGTESPAVASVDLNYEKKKSELLKDWEIEQQREMNMIMDREKKAQEAADREVLMQRDKFMRIHEEMLQADDKVVDLENYRHKRQQEELQKEMELLNEKGLLTAELEMEFQMAKEEQEAAHQSRLKNLKEQAHQEDIQRQLVQLEGYETLFGSLGDIFDSFGARQSKARRLLLVAEKAAAIKSATISINEGIANSARLGFPQNIGAIAATVGATAGLIANIEDVGVAHGGLTNVPKEQTFFLDKGERVVSPKQNRDLTEFLRSQGGGNVTRIEVINNIPGVQMQASAEQDGETMRLIITSMENKLRTDLSNGRGIWDQAKQKYGWSTKGSI